MVSQLNVSASSQVRAVVLAGLTLCLLGSATAWAQGTQVTFQNIAQEDAMGLKYSRTSSPTHDAYLQLMEKEEFTFEDAIFSPMKGTGAPGVAILDYDNDGDLDLYVTNGPETANSLYANQLAETGVFEFVDLGEDAGIAATDQDSSGVCYGDVDNDGDHDLFVLSAFEPNRFFRNEGDGTFTDITEESGLGGVVRNSMSCSFGDVNGDGLLDVAIANSYFNLSHRLGVLADPFGVSDHNQLYINQGGNSFVDVSAEAGIETFVGIPPSLATVTWAVALVDYDQDGDVDMIHADDQAAIPLARDGGVDRGWVRILENDGNGQFTDVTFERNMGGATGHWMGLSFGDLNQDGYMDLFATNVGDWEITITSPIDPVIGSFVAYELGDGTSRWFLGGEGGMMQDPGVGELVGTPFGWGTSMVDYDNDGDDDVVYYGGADFVLYVILSNPGTLLRNDGDATMRYDAEGLGNTPNRSVQGVATGDLNGDGYIDIATVSNFDVAATTEISTYNHAWGSPFDGTLHYGANLVPTDDKEVFSPDPVDFLEGSLAVELNSGNGYKSVGVDLLGTVGLTSGGQVNRDGIGAVVSFRTPQGKRMMQPVLGGSSYASQNQLTAHFGLGGERRGAIDVLWPGGVRNRLYGARPGQQILFPEIPCGFDAKWASFTEYSRCVSGSLGELLAAEVISPEAAVHFLSSAVLAYLQDRGLLR